MAETQDVGPILNGIPTGLPDIDPEETREWVESLAGLVDSAGRDRARYVMLRLLESARAMNVGVPSLTTTDYINTIPAEKEPWFPGDEEIERRFRAYLRWNAAVLVHRAQRPGVGVGGHISTYASAATLYEVGFNHFWRGPDHPGGGDQIFFQGHASPGMYARAFLEGRLTETELDGFRQEHSHVVDGQVEALPSYPHPRLMPNFWQFPTVSMGLGPMNAIYQAQFNKYLHNRGIKDTSQQRVWAFLGDGEMDEVESRGLLQTAANDELDNLTFVINCNLQRLDGPVRGNGKIIQELEAFFRGAGWNVIKIVWGRGWDPLLAADRDSALVNLMNKTPDGDYQTFRANDGKYVREFFFERDPRTAKLVEGWSDDDIWWKQGSRPRVGIGTDTPTSTLHVLDEAAVTGDDAGVSITNASTTSGSGTRVGLKLATSGQWSTSDQAKNIGLLVSSSGASQANANLAAVLNGNVVVGSVLNGMKEVGTSGQNVLAIQNGAAPTDAIGSGNGQSDGGVQLYVTSDATGVSTLHIMDGSGHVVELHLQNPLSAPDNTTLNPLYDASTAAVIENMRTRINELEARMRALGLLP